MSERTVRLLLDDICAATEKATRYVGGMSFDQIVWQILHHDLPRLHVVIRDIRS